MKVIKSYTLDGHEVEISARFESNGHTFSRSVLVSDSVDCVKLMGEVIDTKASPFSSYGEKTIYKTASSMTHYRGGLLKKKHLSIRESYEFALLELEQEILEFIDENNERDKIIKSDKEMTDGLPDSLNDL